MPKTALVISGGGSKGAFAVGVAKYLIQEKNLDFDIICGTSTGSLMAPLLATKDLTLLEQLYTTKKTEDILLKGNVIRRFVDFHSLYDVKPLERLLQDTYTQAFYDQLTATNKAIFFTTVCLQTSCIVYFSTQDVILSRGYEVIKVAGRDEMNRAILASSCQPVFMPPIEVQPTVRPLRQFVDGGVREYAAIQLAIDCGATEVYAILLSPETSVPEEGTFGKVLPILTRTIDLFLSDVGSNDVKAPQYYNRALQYLDTLKQRLIIEKGLSAAEVEQLFQSADNPFEGKTVLDLHVIRPEKQLASDGGLEFIPAQMTQMVTLGREAAIKHFERWDNGLQV